MQTRRIAASLMIPAFALAGFGCAPKSPAAGVADTAKQAVQDVQNAAALANLSQKAGEVANTNSPEAVAAAVGQYAEFAANLELQQFQKVQPVDAPDAFPKELVYPSASKIVSASDDSSDTYLSKDVTIKTTDSLSAVRDSYKATLGAAPWKITSQSNDANNAEIDAKNADGKEVTVRMSSNDYSKLVEIDVSYSGDVSTQ